LGFNLDTIGNFVVLFTSLFAVIAKGDTTAGIVGLSVSYAMRVSRSDSLDPLAVNAENLSMNI
jgi:hypothetical protein